MEEERRLFYVAITRAEKQLTLCYAESRYRWGQFTITEPSRFLEEINEDLIDKPRKAINADPFAEKKTSETNIAARRNLKSISSTNGDKAAFAESDTASLQTGMQVEHPKFGKGKVLTVEGNGPNKKATVFFNGIGQKSLLLRFAKLKILG